jgi:hypothetical protein
MLTFPSLAGKTLAEGGDSGSKIKGSRIGAQTVRWTEEQLARSIMSKNRRRLVSRDFVRHRQWILLKWSSGKA